MLDVYLTGSAGYIGKRVLMSLCFRYNVDFLESCDLKNGEDVISYEPKRRPDVIIHLAGQSGAIPSQNDPMNDARQNILGTIKAIQLANRYKAKLIFPTSGAAKVPKSPYGLSKKTCEEYIKLLCDRYVILRLSSIYGHKPRGVVDSFIRDKRCTIYGDGSAVRDFVHVEDISDAIMRAMYTKKGIYEVGSGKGVSVQEIAEATGKQIVYEDERKGEKKKVVLKNELPDWKPKIDVIEFIKSQCNTKKEKF